MDGQPIGKIRNDGYLAYRAAPGRRAVSTHSEKTNRIEINAPPGGSVFIELQPRDGLFLTNGILIQRPPDYGRLAISGLRESIR